MQVNPFKQFQAEALSPPQDRSEMPQEAVAETALRCAQMCSWNWDMVTNEDVFHGDTFSVFGCTPGHDYNSGFRKLVHPEDLEGLERAIWTAAHEHRLFEREYRIIRPDGAVRWVFSRGQFFYDQQNSPVRMVGVNLNITEQKRQQQELESTRSRLQSQSNLLQTIVDNIPVMLCYMGQPGKVDWVNRTWEKTLGWTPEDNGGQLASVMYPDPAELQRVTDIIERADGRPAEFLSTSRSGEKLNTEFLNVKLQNGGNIGIGRDVTVRQRALEKLENSERFLRLVCENIPQMVWIADANGNTEFYNQRWCEFTGLTLEESLGSGWAKVIHPEDLARNNQLWQSTMAQQLPYENELRIRSKTGDYHWFLVRAMPVRDSDDVVLKWFGTSTNITERRLIEDRLRRSEVRYRSLVKAAAQTVWMCDSTGSEFSYVDDWCAFTGQTADEVQNLGFTSAIHPDDVRHSMDAWQRALITRSALTVEQRIRRHDGVYRHMLTRAVPILDEDGSVSEWIGTNTDITDQKLAEQAILRSEKLSTAGRFASTVAHEVNNPLTAVTNIHYLLSTEEQLPDHVRQHLRTADNELRRISHILRQTLAFYREHTSTQRVSVASLVEESFFVFGERLRSKLIRLKLDIPSEMMIETSPGELRQVICNLISNAMDATELNGRITVRARSHTGPGGACVRISVADSGSGMTPHTIQSMFEPFFTTKSTHGTGLGLWVSRQLIERNSGRIRVRSKVGSGTIFALVFPQRFPKPVDRPAVESQFSVAVPQ